MHSSGLLIIVLAMLIRASAMTLGQGEVQMGSYGYQCISECKNDGTWYYWCDAKHPTKHYKGDSYWDYCSPNEEHDYQGTRCYIEHACGNHGYKYKWCYTDEEQSSWGYCGYKVRTNKS